jgi:hypothetical protein
MSQNGLMKKTAQTFVVMAYAVCLLAALAEETRELSWDDLSPVPSASEDPLANLAQDQLDLVLWVLNVLETEPTRNTGNEALYEEVDKAMPEVRKTGIDVGEVLARRKKARTAVVEELNGKRVRMPGYLLPLEVEGTRVTEFFLVPYVGACIHVPPPPPNQIVHVKLVDNESYQSKKLFEPVWVTGVISTIATVKELYLVDGSADINTGYSLEANRVEPYQ